jgi:hypothetical protein
MGQNQYLFSTIVVRIDSGVLGAKPQIATLLYSEFMKIQRLLLSQLQDAILPGKVLVLYSPRQVGKTTLALR